MKKRIIANLILLALSFGAWCLGDYLLVTQPSYPKNIHQWDIAMLIVPAAFLITNFTMFCRQPMLSRLVLTVAVSTLGCGVLFILLNTIGMSFHFAIGGHH